jgi:NAD(P)-dependent dehydrogenase (short-subunit alcohol dehydrogenase family)
MLILRERNVETIKRDQPAEIAGTVLFLCSDLASFAVGQTFVIDVGYATH